LSFPSRSDVTSGMHFGVFIEESRRGVDHSTGFRDDFELVDVAEASGVDGVWLGEIHFNPDRSVMSAQMVVASSIATRTKRIRVGTAVNVLPLIHPLRIAEEAATLDHISGGRLDFGVGRSGAARSYKIYGIPYEESQARFLEALEIIRKAWEGKPFSYKGRFWAIENANVSPRPLQQPHPPLRMAATTPETFLTVAQMGLAIFVGLRGMDIPELRHCVASYRAAWREAGHPGNGSVYLRIPIFAGVTPTAAFDEPCETIMYYFRRQAELTRAGMGFGDSGDAQRRDAQAERLASLTYEEILRTKVAFGTAAALRDRLIEMRDELRLDGIVAELNPGGMLSMPQVLRTLRILTEEVVPAIR
jgi:alkanesulfonate monooxygenase SsuD/methylene tetrahydromethanopterin reductase-like flavin-dependent oxidoreductase (luciferase family)